MREFRRSLPLGLNLAQELLALVPGPPTCFQFLAELSLERYLISLGALPLLSFRFDIGAKVCLPPLPTPL
jgi:hypothetical protein